MTKTIALLSGLTLAACGPSNGPGAYKADFKTSSSFFTQMKTSVDNSGMDAATFVHKLQRTWYSNNIQGNFTAEVPVGTVAIKETTDDKGVAAAHLVMVKKAKDTWFYEVRSPDGTALADKPNGDNVMGCHGCHTKFKANDYLAGTAVKN
jgi:hypothetical protein